MAKYRIHKMPNCLVLQKYQPPTQKKNGQWTDESWHNDKYYGQWEHLIKAILTKQIIPIGDDLQTQLEDLPAAIDRATQEIIESIEILGKDVLIL